MPSAEGNPPDELGSILSELTGGNESEEGSNTAVTDLLKPSGAHGGQPQQGQPQQAQPVKFMGREYKTLADAERDVKSLRKEFDSRSQKANLLDSMLKNPVYQRLAQTDPEVRDALAKAGYNLAEEEAEEDEDSQEEKYYEEAWRNPVTRQLLVEHEEFKIERQLNGLQDRIGRSVSPEEWTEMKNIMHALPQASVEQAWKLSKGYAKELQMREDKRVEDEIKRRGGTPNRPRPNPAVLPGQKLDLSKPVTQLNDQEKAAKLMEIIARTSGGK